MTRALSGFPNWLLSSLRSYDSLASVDEDNMDTFFTSAAQRKRQAQLLSTLASHNEDPAHLPPEFFTLSAFRQSTLRAIIYIMLSIASAGTLAIVGHWYPYVRTNIMRKKARSFREADYVLLQGRNRRWAEVAVNRESSDITGSDARIDQRTIIWFTFRKQRYVYSLATASFQRQCGRLQASCADMHMLKCGLTVKTARNRLAFDGANTIQIDDASVIMMLLGKIVHPFYVFQVLAVTVWMLEAYYPYAILILLMSSASIAWEIRGTKLNERNLRNMAKFERTCKVVRDGLHVEVPTEALVAGDAVVLEDDPGIVPCDMVLIQGEAIMDESTLTGETIPVAKMALTSDPTAGSYAPDQHRASTLFGGSTLMQVKRRCDFVDGDPAAPHAIAIVTATGFASSKGDLFRSILFPTEMRNQFQKDSYAFLSMLGAFALVALVFRVISGLRDRLSTYKLILECLDLFTIAVPPALPLILTVGTGVSLERLRKLRIFCVDPERINHAGRVNVMAWDKTGTLTESTLQWAGMEPADNGNFIGFSSQFRNDGNIELVARTCHSLNIIHGETVGHPVDLEVFQQTGGHILPENTTTGVRDRNLPLEGIVRFSESQSDIEIIKRFGFDAHVQRNTVIVKMADSSSLIACVKGSPEAVKSICLPESLPVNYDQVCHRYAVQGFYILACGVRRLGNTLPEEPLMAQISSLRREEVETKHAFCGFILLENRAKEESRLVIDRLKAAHIRSIMITGDGPYTAIHVARKLDLCQRALLLDLRDGEVVFSPVYAEPGTKSRKVSTASTTATPSTNATVLARPYKGAISSVFADDAMDRAQVHPVEELTRHLTHATEQIELVITGNALDAVLNKYESPFANWLVGRVRIFARAKPSHKTWIIEKLKEQDNYVGMCGDGTNDCGAIKAAHVGIALSEAEASVVAPFTSGEKSVLDVWTLLREGRCALDTSFVAFKYMMLYPATQVIMVATLYYLGTELSNNQYLFDDLFIVAMTSLLMLYTGPASKLESVRPTDSLFSPSVLASVIGQFLINSAFFATAVGLLVTQKWYCSVKQATNGLDNNFQPVDGVSWPCYPINVSTDVHNGTPIRTHENTVIWLYTHFQLAIVPFALTLISKFRLPVWTNFGFSAYLLALFCALTGMLLSMGREGSGYEIMTRLFSLNTDIPGGFRFGLWCMAMANMACCVAFEILVVQDVVRRRMTEKENRKKLENDRKRERAVGIGLPEMDALDHSQSRPIFGIITKFGWWNTVTEEDQQSLVTNSDVHEMESLHTSSIIVSDEDAV
ncbi:hypothetical protein BC832DRAFT_147677 [Gaertneriomyces semiglobifer]|nr:hypothetical protein BC832DRAFT_147677 [Gaertneriomyces semiglobifer]